MSRPRLYINGLIYSLTSIRQNYNFGMLATIWHEIDQPKNWLIYPKLTQVNLEFQS